MLEDIELSSTVASIFFDLIVSLICLPSKLCNSEFATSNDSISIGAFSSNVGIDAIWSGSSLKKINQAVYPKTASKTVIIAMELLDSFGTNACPGTS